MNADYGAGEFDQTENQGGTNLLSLTIATVRRRSPQPKLVKLGGRRIENKYPNIETHLRNR
jgi:hypothetical protein